MPRGLWFAWVSLLLLACGDDPYRVEYSGTAGQPVKMELYGWVPRIEAQAAGASLGALIDTGSPLTVIAPTALPSVQPGEADIDLQAFGVTFPSLPVVVAELFPDPGICDPPHPTGLVGGDLLRAFRLGLDYRGKRAFLFDGPDADPPVGQGIETSTTVTIEVLGGGVAQLSGVDRLISVDATRVLLAEAEVEGTPHVAVVDTGASLVVVRQDLYHKLDPTGRPSLCCQMVTTLYGTIRASIGRLKQLSLGGARVSNVPVLIWEDTSFFDAISAEVGRKVELLVGGSFLRRFAVHLDYEGKALQLGWYLEQDHVDPDEFVGPGFTMCKARKSEEGMVVVDVFEGSSAQSAGVNSGDRLIMVAGQSVANMSLEQVEAMLRGPIGSSVDLIFAGAVKKTVQVERLLADYN